MIRVSDLYSSPNLVPDDPGYYKWYCNENDFDEILTRLNVTDLQERNKCKDNSETAKGPLFCIYLGIARKSLRQRICRMHFRKDIKRSTLRLSLSAMFDINPRDEDAITERMSDLFLEWVKFPGNNPTVEEKEEELINKSFKILNGAKNHHALNECVKRRRRQLRREKRFW